MITIEMAAVLTEAPLEGFNVRDRRGKEGITLDDVREGLAEIRWNATTKPSGLLAGLPQVQRMASPNRINTSRNASFSRRSRLRRRRKAGRVSEDVKMPGSTRWPRDFRQQPGEVVLDGCVAFAGRGFQFCPVCNGDSAAISVRDNPSLF